MSSLFLRIYDFLHQHRWLRGIILSGITLLFFLLAIRVNYSEDISAFIALDSKHSASLTAFQQLSQADNIVALIHNNDTITHDPEAIIPAIDDFIATIHASDTTNIIANITYNIDINNINQLTDHIYQHIPFYLTGNDYNRIDSLLNNEQYIETQLLNLQQQLLLPSTALIQNTLQSDPLNLFAPVLDDIQHNSNALSYDIYNGYIFTPDHNTALVLIPSPYGATETEHNSHLIATLQAAATTAMTTHEGINITLTGAPVIAVINAKQIKKDTILSVTIALILILFLLFAFFRNVINILLISLSTLWGWLFGIAALTIFHNEISLIVIGISSVVIGIAVNYPLHLIAHNLHTTNIRTALKEIVTPLLVGNITTVGAFLALIPLRSTALRDLGLFAAFMLIGTIIFTILFLPHLVRRSTNSASERLSRLVDFSIQGKAAYTWIIIIITIILSYFAINTSFDTNMAHINYLPNAQKDALSVIHNLTNTNNNNLYLLSSANNLDDALDANLAAQTLIQPLRDAGTIAATASCDRFRPSITELSTRLMMWNNFTTRYDSIIHNHLPQVSNNLGFAPMAFYKFFNIIDSDYSSDTFSPDEPLIQALTNPYISTSDDGNTYNVLSILNLDIDDMAHVKDHLNNAGLYAFDQDSMNSAIANNLSNDFNYIGLACSIIVFIFLWLSLGSIELAIIAFIPMAVSWIWILGIMTILHIQFNIVNIILATFIFGQGDDYTIFITEGATFEYAYRRKILPSYKSAILLSAAIMFIGIGSLIVSKHPALQALAQVTILGMLSVVITAYLLPPLLHTWLVTSKGKLRRRPITLARIITITYSTIVFFVQLATVYVLAFFLFIISKDTPKKQSIFRRYIQRLYQFDFKHIYGVSVNVVNPIPDNYPPSIIIANHQSFLDAALMLMFSPNIILVSNEHAIKNNIIKPIYHWLHCITIDSQQAHNSALLQQAITDGYHILIFPEGQRNDNSSILRFHKGAFLLAQQLQLDIIPVIIHGANNVMPNNSFTLNPGRITIKALPAILNSDTSFGDNYVERTRNIHRWFVEQYALHCQQYETATYFAPVVIDRYRYKGFDISHTVARNIKKHHAYSDLIDNFNNTSDTVIIEDDSFGEVALLFALVHPNVTVYALSQDDDHATILRVAAQGTATNIIPITDIAQLPISTPLFITTPQHTSEPIAHNT